MKPIKIIALIIIGLFAIVLIMRCGNDYVEHIETNSEIVSQELFDSICQTEEILLDTDSLSVDDNDTISLEIPRFSCPTTEQILKRTGYTCSYNQNTRNANWVAWHLTKNHADGPWSRKGIPYIEDADVVGAKQELSDWYNHKLNIDHGHLCPAADNEWDKEAMIESFLLTNMCPQNSNLNQNVWETLESRCRGWARHYGEVYIVAGPIFYNNNYKTIGSNKVGVPDAFYKVVLCMADKPKALGFIFPNEDPKSQNIKDYMCSVDEVENITKIDFFYILDDNIENDIEAISNLNIW